LQIWQRKQFYTKELSCAQNTWKEKLRYSIATILDKIKEESAVTSNLHHAITLAAPLTDLKEEGTFAW